MLWDDDDVIHAVVNSWRGTIKGVKILNLKHFILIRESCFNICTTIC